MVSKTDIENITKAFQGSSLLVEDLKALAQSRNPLVAELSMDLLKDAVEIEKKLKHIEVISQPEKGRA